MPAGDRKPGQLLECRACHRVGYRGYVPWGDSGWECSNDRACHTRLSKTAKSAAREAEYREYGRCTDCGVDARAIGETAYRVKRDVWESAYPGYYSRRIGIGSSRPCIGCLERRLGRTLTREDFDMEWGTSPELSDRLNQRLEVTDVLEDGPIPPEFADKFDALMEDR